MNRLTLSFLGSPKIEHNGKMVKIGRKKAVSLLAYLAVTNESHERATLATLLWPDYDQADALASLRNTFLTLKKSVGEEWFNIQQHTIGLNAKNGIWCDTDQFLSHVAECASHGHPKDKPCPACLSGLSGAIALYRDDFLTGFTLRDSEVFDEWQRNQTEFFRREYLNALKKLVLLYKGQQNVEQTSSFALQYLASNPTDEEIHRQLMELYIQAGNYSAALSQYEYCVDILEKEIGTPPHPETTALIQEIRGQQPLATTSKPGATFQASSTLPVVATINIRHNLPNLLTPFWGREKELAELMGCLEAPGYRLLTLTGLGGVGKTRLAIQSGHDYLKAIKTQDRVNNIFPDGIFFIPLASLQSSDLMVPTIAHFLDFSFYGRQAPKTLLMNYLREKHILLIFDSFEHLLDNTDILTEILTVSAGIKILVTSRERLHLPQETLLEIKGLEFPEHPPINGNPITDNVQRYSALQMFLQRAQRVYSGFTFTAENILWVMQLCRLVEGMPLGIELTASWVNLYSCQEIVNKLEEGLDNLSSKDLIFPQRHHSLKAALEASWRLLSVEEKMVFCKLSIFRGGFTREAAQTVAEASRSTLGSLLDKSLLAMDAAGRYSLHEVLRQFAHRKLNELPEEMDEITHRHCDFYGKFLDTYQGKLEGKSQKERLKAVGKEIDNIRSGWKWAIEKQIQTVILYLIPLYKFYNHLSWYQEGILNFEWAIQTLHRKPDQSLLNQEQTIILAMIRIRLGHFYLRTGLFEKSKDNVQSGLNTVREFAMLTEMGQAFTTLGEAAIIAGDYTLAKQYYDESYEIYKGTNNTLGIAAYLTMYGVILSIQGEYEKAQDHLEKGLQIYRELDNPQKIAYGLGNISMNLHHLGRYEEANQVMKEGLQILREINDSFGICIALNSLGGEEIAQKNFEAAILYLREGLILARKLNERRLQVHILNSLGSAFKGIDDYQEAAKYSLEGLSLARELNYEIETLSALNNLGALATAQNLDREAVGYYLQALDIGKNSQQDMKMLEIFQGMASFFIRLNKKEMGLELAGFVLHHPSSSKPNKSSMEELIGLILENMGREQASVILERGRMKTAKTIITELIEELNNESLSE